MLNDKRIQFVGKICLNHSIFTVSFIFDWTEIWAGLIRNFHKERHTFLFIHSVFISFFFQALYIFIWNQNRDEVDNTFQKRTCKKMINNTVVKIQSSTIVHHINKIFLVILNKKLWQEHLGLEEEDRVFGAFVLGTHSFHTYSHTAFYPDPSVNSKIWRK